jgi:exopolyphosphatase / guanosine-5'-triphosphate,3'-diphosphate pyrophosphatase
MAAAMEYETLAAVDLGSNSFHLAVGRVEGEQIYPLDSLKDSVRLGSGVTKEKQLTPEVQERALATLKQFSERLAGMPRAAVRAVGTNALRIAKNSGAFLKEAEKTLGFPIDVISGREEARLIYLGVIHSIPASPDNRLVVDIGGGSTEFIIGNGPKTRAVESLYVGCVSYSDKYFADGKIEKKAMKAAELAAREEVQAIGARYQKLGWKEAVGSSGTAKSIAEALIRNGQDETGITAKGLEWLRDQLVNAGDLKKVAIEGLRDERLPVIAGGVAVMSGIFDELGIERMTVADGALRQGVLWDLFGRVHQADIRDVTVERIVRRYHLDQAQAKRVKKLALALLADLSSAEPEALVGMDRYLGWAASLHEIGISISQGAYHKHSAYILANADMPGFSRQEQGWLSNLVLSQRGKLAKMQAAFADDARLAALAFCLRIAVIFSRSRRDLELPEMHVSRTAKGFRVTIDPAWLEQQTLIALALESERGQWQGAGLAVEVAS